ncbi:nicotinamidase-like amidase [Burkholderiales bacterium JOSHI_001]|nr:nicotinamidase-like amidase [Burkholderiales bacterium JOSHI_001]
MTMNRESSALVLVDYQGRLMPAVAGHEAMVQEALFLGHVANELDIPVLGTEQNPAGLGPNLDSVRALCSHTLTKMHFDATKDGLLDKLRAARPGLSQVVLAGCEAHVCLLQTALGLLRAGLQVFVVPQACGSRRPEDKALALQRLQQQGAVLVNGEMVAFEWLQSCTAPQFKAVLNWVKQRPAPTPAQQVETAA